jgi:ABC-type branched-subunit amino acid transport system substrate-binding protein
VAFSPELNDSRTKIKAWLLLIARAKNKRVSSRLISRTLKNANISAEFRGLPGDLQEHLKEEYKNYYRIKGEASQLRMNALETLAKALATQGNRDKEKIIKALQEREQQRSTARKIRNLRGKTRMGSTTMVTVTDPNGEKMDIMNQKDMEKAIFESNKKKFS